MDEMGGLASEALFINQSVSHAKLVEFLASALRLLPRMHFSTGGHGFQIHIDQTLHENLVCLDSRGMAAAFPEGHFATFPLVVFLGGPSCGKLHGSRDHLTLAAIENRKMDVIGSGHTAQDAQSVSLPGFEQPVQPSPAISSELQQKLPFMQRWVRCQAYPGI
jgi:hypothetical protein